MNLQNLDFFLNFMCLFILDEPNHFQKDNNLSAVRNSVDFFLLFFLTFSTLHCFQNINSPELRVLVVFYGFDETRNYVHLK